MLFYDDLANARFISETNGWYENKVTTAAPWASRNKWRRILSIEWKLADKLVQSLLATIRKVTGFRINVFVRFGLPFSWPSIVVLAHTQRAHLIKIYCTLLFGRAITTQWEKIRQSKRKTDHIPHTHPIISENLWDTNACDWDDNKCARDNAIAILAMCHVCSMLFMCSHSDVVLL